MQRGITLFASCINIGARRNGSGYCVHFIMLRSVKYCPTQTQGHCKFGTRKTQPKKSDALTPTAFPTLQTTLKMLPQSRPKRQALMRAIEPRPSSFTCAHERQELSCLTQPSSSSGARQRRDRHQWPVIVVQTAGYCARISNLNRVRHMSVGYRTPAARILSS